MRASVVAMFGAVVLELIHERLPGSVLNQNTSRFRSLSHQKGYAGRRGLQASRWATTNHAKSINVVQLRGCQTTKPRPKRGLRYAPRMADTEYEPPRIEERTEFEGALVIVSSNIDGV